MSNASRFNDKDCPDTTGSVCNHTEVGCDTHPAPSSASPRMQPLPSIQVTSEPRPATRRPLRVDTTGISSYRPDSNTQETVPQGAPQPENMASFIVTSPTSYTAKDVNPIRLDSDRPYVSYGDVCAPCQIEVVDYSQGDARGRGVRMNNEDFLKWVDDGKSMRPAGAKVRWINVAGISSDIIHAIATKLNHAMHPLAVKSLLKQHDQARSKSEYYREHLYVRVLTHMLQHSTEETSSTDASSDGLLSPSSASSEARSIRNGSSSDKDPYLTTTLNARNLSGSSPIEGAASPMPFKSHFPVDILRTAEEGQMSPSSDVTTDSPARRTAITTDAKLYRLKGADQVDVDLKLLDIFMYQDNTIITFFHGTDLSFTHPITARLRHNHGLLRQTEDASLLLQNLLDLVVDRTLEVADEYRRRIQRLEQTVLKSPEVPTVRALRVLAGDLIFHKRTMGPIKTLVSVLKDSDKERSAAAMRRRDSDMPGKPYITADAKVYLADVQEHMEYALASLEMYAEMAKNLMDYTFDMASYEMNKAMRSLNLVTVIFFPLTLLTGYFGMNFAAMWSVQEHSDVLFWKIAIPVVVVCLPLFLWQDLMRGVRHLKKLWIARQIKSIAKDAGWRKKA